MKSVITSKPILPPVLSCHLHVFFSEMKEPILLTIPTAFFIDCVIFFLKKENTHGVPRALVLGFLHVTI